MASIWQRRQPCGRSPRRVACPLQFDKARQIALSTTGAAGVWELGAFQTCVGRHAPGTQAFQWALTADGFFIILIPGRRRSSSSSSSGSSSRNACGRRSAMCAWCRRAAAGDSVVFGPMATTWIPASLARDVSGATSSRQALCCDTALVPPCVAVVWCQGQIASARWLTAAGYPEALHGGPQQKIRRQRYRRVGMYKVREIGSHKTKQQNHGNTYCRTSKIANVKELLVKFEPEMEDVLSWKDFSMLLMALLDDACTKPQHMA